MDNRMPTETDWADYQIELDCLEAHQLFAGKDTASLTSLFVESIGRCVDGLHFMPPKVFNYYVLAFCDYVKSAETLLGLSNDDRARAAAGLFTLLENKLHICPDELKTVYPQLIETARYVAEHQINYFADKNIYGDFVAKLVVFNALAKESDII